MTRRGGGHARSPRRNGARSLEAQVAAIMSGGSWFDADRYTVDGGTSKVGAFVDRMDSSHTLAQASGTFQVALPSPDPAFGGFNSALFAAHYYDSSRPASAWKHLHDGTGCDVICVFAPTTAATVNCMVATVAATSASDNSGIGFVLDFYNTGSSGQEFYIANGLGGGGGSMPVTIAGVGSTRTVGLPSYAEASYKENASPEYASYNESTLIQSGTTTNTPSSSNPTGTLRLGASRAGIDGFHARMNWRELFLSAPGKVFSSGERAIIRQYIAQKYGMVTDVDQAVLRNAPGAVAYYQAENVTGSAWAPYSGLGPILTNISTPGVATAVSQLNNRTGTRGTYSGPLVLSPSSGLTMLVISYSPTGDVGLAATTQYGVINTAQSILYLGASTFAANVNGGTNENVNPAQPTRTVGAMQVATFQAGQPVRLWQNALTANAGATVTTVFPSDTFIIGALDTTPGYAQPATARTARVIVWPRVLSQAEINVVLRRFTGYYGLTLGA